MKILRIFLFTTFLVSFLTGLIAGILIFKRKTSPHQTETTLQNFEPKPSKQEGIWLIAIDHIDNTPPHIKGIWLLAYIPGYNKIKPLPFYPSENTEKDIELANVFRFENSHEISPYFWESLNQRGQPIQNYIIFDDIAASEIINYFGGISIEGKHLNGSDIIEQSKNNQQEAQQRIALQKEVMENLCQRLFDDQPGSDIASLLRNINGHMISNLDLSQQLEIYRNMVTDGTHPICEFPDLYEKPTIGAKP